MPSRRAEIIGREWRPIRSGDPIRRAASRWSPVATGCC